MESTEERHHANASFNALRRYERSRGSPKTRWSIALQQCERPGRRRLPATRDEAIKLAGDAICANIKCRGTLYNCDGVGYILLKGQEAKPIRISPDDARFSDLLMRVRHWNRNGGRKKNRKVPWCSGHSGWQTKLRFDTSFTIIRATQTAYMCEQVGQLLRVTKERNRKGPKWHRWAAIRVQR